MPYRWACFVSGCTLAVLYCTALAQPHYSLILLHTAPTHPHFHPYSLYYCPANPQATVYIGRISGLVHKNIIFFKYFMFFFSNTKPNKAFMFLKQYWFRIDMELFFFLLISLIEKTDPFIIDTNLVAFHPLLRSSTVFCTNLALLLIAWILLIIMYTVCKDSQSFSSLSTSYTKIDLIIISCLNPWGINDNFQVH